MPLHSYGNILPLATLKSNLILKVKKIYKWFVQSSLDPKALSLTIKGLIPLLVLLGAEASELNVFADSLTQVVIDAGKFASSVIVAVGFIRKIALSFK